MALFQRQELRQAQTQGLVMTPQLQQAIKLLQLSSLDLAAYVEQQLEENPLLERGDSDEARTPDNDREPTLEAADSVLRDGDIGETAAQLDTDYDNVWDGDGSYGPLGSTSSSRSAGPGYEDGELGFEHTLSPKIGLREHVERQICLELADRGNQLVALQLADMLDDAGYFTGDLTAVAGQLGCDLARVERIFSRLQQLDPPGLFARSLAECLALQLRDRNRLDPAIQALLDNLDLLARRDFGALQEICGVDREDLAEMIAEIRALQPKPALAFDAEPAQTVVPDVLMRPHPDGGWQVELNPDALPKVLVDARYHARVRRSGESKATRDYIAEQYNAANWLVKALHQRATTVLKVASEIVRQQDGFFAHGVQHLRPLTLKDIADAIGMHESTVSRVTANKYIAGPRGLFEMKYFFSSAIQSASGGEAHSAEAVRSRIKKLVDQETSSDVLSDDRIVEILRGAGIDIARRTVAKYREALRIPSSVQRRREKSAGAVLSL